MKPLIAALAIALVLTGCDSTTQTTSGRAYLSQYESVPVTASKRYITQADGTKTEEEVKSLDQRIRESAAVEPVLRFPARIGLARVDRGSLTVIPMEEADGWSKVSEKLGKSFGEFVPVNPMVASMAAGAGNFSPYDRTPGTIDVIRLGAARQHLDAVLIYEVISDESEHRNILSAANTTILGAYILPSERHDAVGLGNALLIDVVQGYPYGTVTTTVKKQSRMSSTWGWGSKDGDKEAFSEKVKAKAAQQLADEAYGMFTELRTKLAEQRDPLKLTKN